MLDEEMGDGDGEVELAALQPAVHPPAPEPVAPSPPAPAVTPDMTALIQALVTGITQANAGTADAIRDALGNAAAMARTPIPENAVDPGHSVYSHPDGDQAHPRTTLKCDTFLGIYDDDGVAKPAFEIFEDTCTEDERVLINELKPGVYRIERNDGITALWRVVQKSDDNGQPTRLIVAVPQQWLSPEQFQQMPGQLNFLKQLVAAQSAVA